MAVPFHFYPTETKKKKEERHQHFSSIDITLRSDSLDLNRRWQLKAGVYPKQDNSVRDGGFPVCSSHNGSFSIILLLSPLTSAGMSLLLKPAVHFQGHIFSLSYKGTGGIETEELNDSITITKMFLV